MTAMRTSVRANLKESLRAKREASATIKEEAEAALREADPRDRPEELEAVRVALHGSPREKLRLVADASRELLRDPEQTEQVFRLGLVLNARHLERAYARFTAGEEGAWLMEHQPAIDRRSVDFEALRALPADTLGGAYARFLDERGLDPDIFQPPPGLPPKVRYLVQRARQTHDLWHVLTGYGTDVIGEVELQAFYFGQSHIPMSLLLATVGAVRSGWRVPGLLRRLIEAYRRGRRAEQLFPVRWELRWERPLSELRRELRLGA